MVAPRLEGNNTIRFVTGVLLPLPDGLSTSGGAGKKNMNGHGEAEVPHADIHSTVSDFVVRHFIDEGRQVALGHSHSRLFDPSERFGNVKLSNDRVNRLISVNVPFLPTVPFWRRAGGTCPTQVRP